MVKADVEQSPLQTGVRVRKAEAVRLRIADAAIRLFLRDGFEETTVDAVAVESGVARRGVFRYFAKKEDIVLAWTSASGRELVGRLDATECQVQPLNAAISAIGRHVAANQSAHAMSLDVGKLIERTPALRARAYEKYLAWENLLSDAMVERGAEPVASRMAAAVAVAGLRIAVREWIKSDGQMSMGHLLDLSYQSLLAIDSNARFAPSSVANE